ADPSTIQLGMRLPRPVLHERIERRVHRMVEQGLLEEVRQLREQGLDRGRTARRAIGYEQAAAVLDGALDSRAAIDSTVAATRRLVRRQDTWFRRDARVRWPDVEAGDLTGRALREIRGARAPAPAPAAEAHGHELPASLHQGPRHRERLRRPR